MKIYTDNKWKSFKYRHDVPTKVLESDFNYLDDEVIDGFIKYRRNWYHLCEFMTPFTPFIDEFSGYHASMSDSFFSGILIKISRDGEQYQIATYIG